MIRIAGLVLIGFGSLSWIAATILAGIELELLGDDGTPTFELNFHSTLGTTTYAIAVAICLALMALGLLTLGSWPESKKNIVPVS